MRNILFAVTLLSFSLSCTVNSEKKETEKEQVEPEKEMATINFQKHYDAFNVNGCFVLLDEKSGRYRVFNENQRDSAFTPASTFKICNSFISFNRLFFYRLIFAKAIGIFLL